MAKRTYRCGNCGETGHNKKTCLLADESERVALVTALTDDGFIKFLGCYGTHGSGVRYYASQRPEDIDYRIWMGNEDMLPAFADSVGALAEHFSTVPSGKWGHSCFIPLDLARKLAPGCEFVLHE